MSHYRNIKAATAEVVGVRLVKKASTARAHEAIRDLIVANPTHSYQQLAALLGCSRWLVYRVAAEFGVRRSRGAGSPSRRKDGIWRGDAASLAADFDVSEDEAHSVLSELCDRRLIERVYSQTCVIVNWRERDDSDGPSETF
jgi:hypothetical protein